MTYKQFSVGPQFPKTDTVKPTPRTDGAFQASSGAAINPADDMASGPSQFKGLPQPGTTGATVQTPAPTDRPQNDRGVAGPA
jgi:hypothetical protein